MFSKKASIISVCSQITEEFKDNHFGLGKEVNLELFRCKASAECLCKAWILNETDMPLCCVFMIASCSCNRKQGRQACCRSCAQNRPPDLLQAWIRVSPSMITCSF